MMKQSFAVIAATVVCLAAGQAAAFQVESAEEGDARLGYFTINTDGTTGLSFNATSIQNAVILALFLLVLGALLLPLFNVQLEGQTAEGYGYGYEQTGNFEDPAVDAAGTYAGYTKRSLELLHQASEALNKGQQQYGEEQQ